MGFDVNQEYLGDNSLEVGDKNLNEEEFMIHEDNLDVSRASVKDIEELSKTMLTNKDNNSEN